MSLKILNNPELNMSLIAMLFTFPKSKVKSKIINHLCKINNQELFKNSSIFKNYYNDLLNRIHNEFKLYNELDLGDKVVFMIKYNAIEKLLYEISKNKTDKKSVLALSIILTLEELDMCKDSQGVFIFDRNTQSILFRNIDKDDIDNIIRELDIYKIEISDELLKNINKAIYELFNCTQKYEYFGNLKKVISVIGV